MLREYLETTADSLISKLVGEITDEIMVVLLQGEPFDVIAGEIEEGIEISTERVVRKWIQRGLDLTLTE